MLMEASIVEVIGDFSQSHFREGTAAGEEWVGGEEEDKEYR